jgi:two-component system response regulator AtoC
MSSPAEQPGPTRKVERGGPPRDRLRVVTARGVYTVELPPGPALRIGRAADADIRIDDDSLSRQHACLRLAPTPTIEDLGSANGVRAGGVTLAPHQPTPVASGVPLELGEVTLVLELAQRSAAPHQATAPATFDHLLGRVAASSVSVLILGETGVGKERVAEALHARSRRAAGPLVKLNCAALPEHLIEGELFGFERGAFTGATHSKPGVLESAHGGTLFLDEIGELPPPVQAKLLRVIEQREVQRLGALRPVQLDVRFVAATHRDVHAAAAAGTFRADLLFRIDGFTLRVAPLRERRGELAGLAQVLLAEIAARDGGPARTLSAAALAHLQAQPWPGNIRQLRNELERAHLRASGEMIVPDDFVDAATGATAPTTPAADGGALRDAVDAAERTRVMAALTAAGGNQTKAALALGVSRRTLVSRLTAWGQTKPRGRGGEP